MQLQDFYSERVHYYAIQVEFLLGLLMITHNSQACKKGKREEVKGSMAEFEGNANYREWCNPGSNMLHHNNVKGVHSYNKFENNGSVFCRHIAVSSASTVEVTHEASVEAQHPFSHFIRHTEKRWAYSTPHQQCRATDI